MRRTFFRPELQLLNAWEDKSYVIVRTFIYHQYDVAMATEQLRYRWGGDCAARHHSALTRSCVIYSDHE